MYFIIPNLLVEIHGNSYLDNSTLCTKIIFGSYTKLYILFCLVTEQKQQCFRQILRSCISIENVPRYSFVPTNRIRSSYTGDPSVTDTYTGDPSITDTCISCQLEFKTCAQHNSLSPQICLFPFHNTFSGCKNHSRGVESQNHWNFIRLLSTRGSNHVCPYSRTRILPTANTTNAIQRVNKHYSSVISAIHYF